MMRVRFRAMNTVDDVFDKFGGPTALARAIGIKVSAASEMRRRASIPVTYWRDLVAVAKQHGLPLTIDRLVSMHTGRKAAAKQRARAS